jgi:hypothetical protein
VPSFVNHVVDVVGISPEGEMTESWQDAIPNDVDALIVVANAVANVTDMQDGEVVGDRSMTGKRPGRTVDQFVTVMPATATSSGVSIGFYARRPQPATIRFLDVGPEALGQWDREGVIGAGFRAVNCLTRFGSVALDVEGGATGGADDLNPVATTQAATCCATEKVDTGADLSAGSEKGSLTMRTLVRLRGKPVGGTARLRAETPSVATTGYLASPHLEGQGTAFAGTSQGRLSSRILLGHRDHSSVSAPGGSSRAGALRVNCTTSGQGIGMNRAA